VKVISDIVRVRIRSDYLTFRAHNGLDPSQTAPDFTLRLLDGGNFNSSESKGKVTVLKRQRRNI
jgi:hypothetical protein